MKPRVFIDGEAGTTGLELRARLERRSDLELLHLPPEKRKDPRARRELLNEVDLAILCLPDEAAREAVSWIENPSVRILDASSAHRVAEGWVYGFPELIRGQAERIASARQVANPGCYATGATALIRPLVEAGLLPAGFPVSLHAISGYSGGGRPLIEAMERGEDHPLAGDYRAYGLNLRHKHVPEIQRYGALEHPPIFSPSVARFRQGMLVYLPLPLWALPKAPRPRELYDAFAEHYQGQPNIRVLWGEGLASLDPQALNGTNLLELFVFGEEEREQALLVARLDNLGKGASGAAVQNLELMLGLGSAREKVGARDTETPEGSPRV